MPNMPQVSPGSAPRRRGGDTAERILDVAEACFAQRGYAGTSLRDVAEGVGIRIPSLYNHFPNKASLYSAVLARGMTPILELLTRFVEEGEEAHADVPRVTTELMTLLGRRPNLPRLIQYELLSGGEQLTQLLDDWLRPTLLRGLAMLQNTPAAAYWKPDQLPILMLTFLNIVVSHFTTAPLYEHIVGEDLLAEPALARQIEFFTQIFAALTGAQALDEVPSPEVTHLEP